MNKSSLLRGITQKDLKQVVAKAFSEGWEIDHMRGTTHAVIVWPPTGQTVSFGTTPKNAGSAKTLAREIEAISGVVVVKRHNHRKSRKGNLGSDFSVQDALREQRQRHEDEVVKNIDRLMEEHTRLVARFVEIAQVIPESSGDNRKTHIARAAEVMRRLEKVELILKEILPSTTPCPSFDPYNYIKI